MYKNNPKYFQRNNLPEHQQHQNMSRQRHFREQMTDYGLRSQNRIHTPSSGFSYSDADSYETERSMNPNRDLYERWSSEDRNYDFNKKVSDHDLAEFVYGVLVRHPEIDAGQIDIEARRQVVLIRGQVETRRMKRLIEDVIYGLPGVRDVQNRIEVMDRDPDRRRIARSLA